MKIKLRKIIELAIAGYLFLLPLGTIWIFKFGKLNGRDWQYGTMGIYATEILWLAIFILASVVLVREKKDLNFSLASLKNKKVFWPLTLLLGFLIWSLLSVIWSPYHILALYDWLKLLEVISLVLILIKFSDWKKNFIALSLAGGLQAVLAVVQFASQRVIASKWLGISAHAVYPLGDAVTETPVGRFLRSYGSFPHPNIFGGFMVIAFFATLFWLKTAKGHWKFAGWFFLILNFLGLFLSFSRSAWLGFALAFIFWLVMNLKEKETRLETAKIIFIVIAFSGVLVLNFWPILDTRISSSGRLEQKSNQGRITLLIQDVGVVKNKWFLGTGFGNYTYYLYQQDSSESAHDYQPVHNVFLLIWSELGIFGLIIFLTLLFFISWRVWLTRNWEALALILILLPISLVDHYLWTLYEGLIISALVIAFAFRSRSQCGLWKF